MITSRLLYRTRQFWMALKPATPNADLEILATLLNGEQMALFQRMQSSEQAHSLRLLQCLLEQGERDKDLCVAALLHDVGKTRYPLHLWERVWIVLVQAIFPGSVQRWGHGRDGQLETAAWWQKAFVVAVQHPRWGAEMADEAGVSLLAVNLIRRHQEKLASPVHRELTHEETLLQILQSVDDLS
jgi:hypothetical protein